MRCCCQTFTFNQDFKKLSIFIQLKLMENKNSYFILRFQIFDYLGGEIFVDTVGTGVAQMQVSEMHKYIVVKE